jgi:hypothetical protein
MRPLALAALLALSACSSQVLRDNAQGWREAECDKVLDPARHERCLNEARGKQ